LLASVGDPDRVAFARSCMKPVQAAISLRAIDIAVPDVEIAVMCSSHNGEPVHVRAVRRLLRRGGLDDAALRNPAGRPADPEAAARVRAPAPVFQDCSGNHAGILVASARAGWPIDTYRSRSHPHHRRVLPLVRALAGAEPIVGVGRVGNTGLPAELRERAAARGPDFARGMQRGYTDRLRSRRMRAATGGAIAGMATGAGLLVWAILHSD
jgi:L-asparaginase II